MIQPNLFETKHKCHCVRCDALCKVDPLHRSKAKMLKRGSRPKGLCINCAVHDFLRNMYPANLLLAESGPKALAIPHLQDEFAGIMKAQCSDALPDEINWQEIINNWDLPFTNKIKRTSMNPMNEEDMDREIEFDKKRTEMRRRQMDDPRTPEQRIEDVEKEFVEKVVPLL